MNKTRVMLLGDIDIRDQARTALLSVRNIEIVGELAGFEHRHERFVEELAPDVIVIDGAAFDFDASATISILRESGRAECIVAVAEDDRTRMMLFESGADAVVSTQEALRTAVAPVGLRQAEGENLDRAA